MTEGSAALIGAAIGAIAGLAGGGFAAIASVRASQIAARAALAPKLHAMAGAIVSHRVAIGSSDETKLARDLELAWNDFGVHQKILCPSRALEILGYLIRRTAKEKQVTAQTLLTVAGQAQDKASRIVGLYSEHLFRFRAQIEERAIIAEWLATESHGLLSDEMRQRIARDVGLSRRQLRRIKLADELEAAQRIA